MADAEKKKEKLKKKSKLEEDQKKVIDEFEIKNHITTPEGQKDNQRIREEESMSNKPLHQTREQPPPPTRVKDRAPSLAATWVEDSMLSTPWRKHKEGDEWSEKTRESLLNEIKDHKLLGGAGIKYINVLLVGEISAGKSSFFNSFESVFKERVANRADAGFGKKSLTTKYRQYEISGRYGKKQPIKFRFCDSMGLEGNAGLSAHDMGKIMDGHLQDQAELRNGVVRGLGYIEKPTEDDKIHCVAFVVNTLSISAMDESVIKKITEIREEALGRHLNPIIILTRVDELCQMTEADTKKVFHSKEVVGKVEEVHKLLGVPKNQIYPVRNYSIEVECETEKDVLILRVAKQILRYSEDFIEDRLAREKQKKKNLKKEWGELNKKQKNPEPESCSEEDSASDTESDSDNRVEPERSKKDQTRSSDFSDRKGKGGKRGSKQALGPAKAKKAPPPLLVKKAPPPLVLATGRMGIALSDFRGDDDDEIPELRNGEEVTEITPDKDGWTKVRGTKGMEGLAPSNYINWVPRKDPKQPPRPAKPVKKLRAVEPFSAKDEEEADLDVDEEVTEIKPDDGGWTMIKKDDGSEGLVPSDFLELKQPRKTPPKRRQNQSVQDSLTESPVHPSSLPHSSPGLEKPALPPSDMKPKRAPKQPPRLAKPVKKWCAVDHYSANDEDEVDLDVDEEVTEIKPDDGGWTLIKKDDGSEGLVPSEFLGRPTSHLKKKTPPKPRQPGSLTVSPIHSRSQVIHSLSPILPSVVEKDVPAVPPPSNRKPSQISSSKPRKPPTLPQSAPPPPPPPTLSTPPNKAKDTFSQPKNLLEEIVKAKGKKCLKSNCNTEKGKKEVQDPQAILKAAVQKRRVAFAGQELSNKISFHPAPADPDSDNSD